MNLFYLFLKITLLLLAADVLIYFGYGKLYSVYLTKKIKGEWKKVRLPETKTILFVFLVITLSAVLFCFMQLIYAKTSSDKENTLFLTDRAWWLADYLITFELFCLIDWVLLTSFHLLRFHSISFLKCVPFSLRLPVIMILSALLETTLPTTLPTYFTGAVCYAIILIGFTVYRCFIWKTKKEVVWGILEVLWKIASLFLVLLMFLRLQNIIFSITMLPVGLLVLSLLLLTAKSIEMILHSIQTISFFSEWKIWKNKMKNSTFSAEEKEEFLSFLSHYPKRFFYQYRTTLKKADFPYDEELKNLKESTK